MSPSPTLLILAAGKGSRYGGLKQIDVVGPTGESLLEYSIFDALRAGFGNVVCVIRREIEADMRSFLESRLPQSVRIDYAFQALDNLPDGFSTPKKRLTQQKPWGTGHAVLAAERLIKNPFLMINADDFYGRQAFSLAFRFLTDDSSLDEYAIVGYPLSETLSDHGPVSRGICRTDENNFLHELVEQKSIARRPGVIV
ncbi:MAG: sugar phosphate nucleotidyltransferase, partial [Pirellulaceae bacterium]